MIVYTCTLFGFLVNGVCTCMVVQLYWLFGTLQAFTGINLTVDTLLCMAILIFHADRLV